MVDRSRSWQLKQITLYLMAVLYVAAGVMHFRNPGFYLQIMPPYLPWHLGLVYLSGVAEIVLGIGLVIPSLTRLAAWGVIALLLAVYPANIHMWWNDVQVDGQPSPAWFHLFRLPMQFVLMLWAWWYTRPAPGAPRDEE
jgi:uncharacterized membrane protein